MNKFKTMIAIVATAGITISMSAQQLKVPAPSPLQTVKQAFGLSEITLEYSRPSAKGRVIYGDVVPFDKVWRTGANASTKITFGDDVFVEGNKLAAGTYAIYTVPHKEAWELMFYKDLTLGGNVADYKTENEVLRVKVKPNDLGYKEETFTISIDDVTPNTCSIELKWEKTRIAFNIKTEIDEKIMKNIESSVMKDTRPYFQAASYYYENGKDLKQALEWADKAIAANDKAYWVVLLKAKIQFKLGDKKGGSDTANKVIALAKEDKNDDYVRMAEKLIKEGK
jgi:tetratricopeptide (TPR) repeat protein